MIEKQPSIKDIAKKLEVSATTISFVLNGKAEEKRISKKVTHRILEYVEKIGYKPNAMAQGLRTGKSGLIVVMVEDIYSKIARVLEDLAHLKGYNILFCSNDNNDEKAIELIDLFFNKQVDGFIIVPSPGLENKIRFLINRNIPVVLFDRYFPNLDVSHVVVDNEKAVYESTNHLFDNHFKKIAFITIDYEQTQMADRLTGYKKAIQEKGGSFKVLKISPSLKHNDRKEAIKQYLKENNHIDGVIFATNYLAEIGLEIIKNNFPNFFEKVGICTFDDELLFELFDPSITAIRQPLDEIGELLLDIILKQIKNGNRETTTSHIMLRTKLHIRDSSIKKCK